MSLKQPLTAIALGEYSDFIHNRVVVEGDDAAALVVSLRAYDSGVSGEAVKERLADAFRNVRTLRGGTTGQIAVTAVTVQGTGAAVGDKIQIVGGGGLGGLITVASVGTGGEVLTVDVLAGAGFTSVPGFDASGVGNGAAEFTITVSNQLAEIDGAAATIAAAS